ncbi:hypothetical protein KY290_013398 [Solanum tuberosum]|uniref:Uncharacterized protein n=1 Tax=Solanum tuberosum TaxID=4113 RepID=A0ABQ7VLJ6_SOLTU|nr:hypothetical protein KY285_012861 [Solanum tuberosum]KAH0769417.1 hypothetical protein KY290_013398 [Solanum tuberosum]
MRRVWANHGDDISIQYSGTPALKGDFVRCGHRTALGDAVDLLQGHYIPAVSRDMKPSSQKGSIETKVVSLITYSAVIMLNMLLFIKFF